MAFPATTISWEKYDLHKENRKIKQTETTNSKQLHRVLDDQVNLGMQIF